MWTDVYWIAHTSALANANEAKLGTMPRPRGNDWLEDELRHLKRSGADVLVSALTQPEAIELELTEERALAESLGMQFVSIPIMDRGVPGPTSANAFVRDIHHLSALLRDGKTIVAHCRQGIGRASLIAVAILVNLGTPIEDAWKQVEDARGRPVPDTLEQKQWIEALDLSGFAAR